MIQGLLLVTMFAVIEMAGLQVPLTVSLVIAIVVILSGEWRWDVEMSMAMGLVVDLVFLNRLGSSSLFMLILGTTVIGLKARISQRTPWVEILAGLAAYFAWEIIWGAGFDGMRFFLGGLLVVGWIRFLSKPSGGGGVILRGNH